MINVLIILKHIFLYKNIRKATKPFTSNLSQNLRSVSYKNIYICFWHTIMVWVVISLFVRITCESLFSSKQLIEITCGINVLQLFKNFCSYMLYVSRYNAYLHWLLSWIKMFIQPILNFEIIHFKHMNKWISRFKIAML